MDESADDKFNWVGKIETFSGAPVDIINFKPEYVIIDDIAQSLSLICRYNGHIPSFYSVAEHSVRVAFWLRDEGYGPLECLTGLLHDASETYVGDMVRPLKRVPGFSAMHQQIESQIAEVIHSVLGGIYPYPQCIHDADKAVYEWEVENIRSGVVAGWSPPDARGRFMASLQNFNELIKEQAQPTS